jgi:hypothetical protein
MLQSQCACVPPSSFSLPAHHFHCAVSPHSETHCYLGSISGMSTSRFGLVSSFQKLFRPVSTSRSVQSGSYVVCRGKLFKFSLFPTFCRATSYGPLWRPSFFIVTSPAIFLSLVYFFARDALLFLYSFQYRGCK